VEGACIEDNASSSSRTGAIISFSTESNSRSTTFESKKKLEWSEHEGIDALQDDKLQKTGETKG
jgi:hypothetical protein